MWLVTAEMHEQLDHAYKNNAIPTAVEQAEYEARFDDDGEFVGQRILKIVGKTAQIEIMGVLTPQISLMSRIFGGGNTTYFDIIEALKLAEQDPEVDNIEMVIDSGGGTISGLHDAITAIQSVTKPVKAIVTNHACSAAYMLASVASEIVAANAAATVGSIGIIINGYIHEHEYSITNTESPFKSADPTTTEGKAKIQEYLDDVYDVFVGIIAAGRNTTVENINKNFGKGGNIVAAKAVTLGMIDSVIEAPAPAPRPSPLPARTDPKANAPTKTETIIMDLKTLQSEHPATYAEAYALGEAAERDRVSSHLTMGAASDAMELAAKAIKEGSPFSQALQAEYMAANITKMELNNRTEDDTAAGAGDGSPAPKDAPAAAAAELTKTFDRFGQLCGVDTAKVEGAS